MSFDITQLLEQWEYQPGQVMVRKFKGKDGKEKIQLRVDLGLLQMNAEGRPDGKRPLGHPSFYDFLKKKLEKHLRAHDGSDEDFVLSGEDCAKLQLEALQYHHRYICLLQLEDFERAIRDSTRNLEVFDFADQYAESDEYAWALQQFRPQVLMLQTRAKASLHLDTKKFKEAITEIEDGLGQIKEFYRAFGKTDQGDQSPEILSLETWLKDVKQQRPLTKRETLEHDLQKAILIEDFEKAARVRDLLRDLATD
jgi:hypothetical protein